MIYHLFVGLEIISLNCMNEVREPSHRRGRKLEKSTFAWNSTRRVLDFILFWTLHKDSLLWYLNKRILPKWNIKFMSIQVTFITAGSSSVTQGALMFEHLALNKRNDLNHILRPCWRDWAMDQKTWKKKKRKIQRSENRIKLRRRQSKM